MFPTYMSSTKKRNQTEREVETIGKDGLRKPDKASELKMFEVLTKPISLQLFESLRGDSEDNHSTPLSNHDHTFIRGIWQHIDDSFFSDIPSDSCEILDLLLDENRSGIMQFLKEELAYLFEQEQDIETYICPYIRAPPPRLINCSNSDMIQSIVSSGGKLNMPITSFKFNSKKRMKCTNLIIDSNDSYWGLQSAVSTDACSVLVASTSKGIIAGVSSSDIDSEENVYTPSNRQQQLVVKQLALDNLPMLTNDMKLNHENKSGLYTSKTSFALLGKRRRIWTDVWNEDNYILYRLKLHRKYSRYTRYNTALRLIPAKPILFADKYTALEQWSDLLHEYSDDVDGTYRKWLVENTPEKKVLLLNSYCTF